MIQVSWKTFELLYCKFIQDNVRKILSESTGFGRRYDKNILVCFFSVHSVFPALRHGVGSRVIVNNVIVTLCIQNWFSVSHSIINVVCNIVSVGGLPPNYYELAISDVE